MGAVEIHHVAVDRELFSKAKAGDEDARNELRRRLNGIELYFHILSVNRDTEDVVTLEELQRCQVVEYATLKSYPISIPEDESA